MRTVLAGLASGALLALAGREGGAAACVLVGLAPLLAAVTRTPSPSRAAVAGAGFACGVLLYGSQLRGLAAVPWSPAPWLAAGITAVLAAGVAGFALATGELARRRGAGTGLAAAPALWVVLEALAGRPPFEIAWLDLGALAAGEPRLLALAPLGGAPLLAAWAVASSACGVGLLRALRAGARPRRAAVVLVLAPLAGVAAPAPPDAAGVRVAAVQPDVPSVLRHGAPRLDPNLRALLRLSERAVAGGADLLVWPETAWDATAARGGHRFVGVVAHALGVPLLTGVRMAGGGGVLRNAVVLATAEDGARVVGEKRHPVPGFEAAPQGDLGRALARRGLWPGRVAPGAPAPPLALRRAGGSLPVGVLVCADLHDAELVRRLRRQGARLLVVLANESDLGPAAAAAGERLARLRAAENRVPVVRVANNGRSLWIDARGRVLAALSARQADAGGAVVAPAGPAPLHARHGPGPALALSLPVTALLLARGSARRDAPIRGARLLAVRRDP